MGLDEFEVQDVIKWVRNNFEGVVAFRSNEKISDIRKANPGFRVFDAQNICYHLSKVKNFWIEDSKTGKKVELFEHKGDLRYKLLKG